jgi:hypothetical protein
MSGQVATIGLHAARVYLGRWRVPGVVPTIPHSRRSLIGPTGEGHTRASADPATLAAWWQRWPWADAALVTTGAVVLIDCDTKHGIDGRDTLAELERRYGRLPDAPTATTPHGGEHRYFRAPAGGVRSSTAKLGAAVDVRGDRSLVFPPPCHGYTWHVGYEAEAVALPALPIVWVAALRTLEAARERTPRFLLPDAIEKGTRNDTLFRYACSMRARAVEWTLATAAVQRANTERCRPPLGTRELGAILASVEGYPIGRQRAA